MNQISLLDVKLHISQFVHSVLICSLPTHLCGIMGYKLSWKYERNRYINNGGMKIYIKDRIILYLILRQIRKTKLKDSLNEF